MAKVSLRVFKNEILFQFEGESATLKDGKTTQRGFKEKTDWGFVFVDPKVSASSARWGVVIAVGPDVKDDIYVGRRVLIENLKWTTGVEFERQEYWKTNEDQVLAVYASEDR